MAATAARLPTFTPALPGRLGGTEGPRIDDPPRMPSANVDAIRKRSGLSPDEHHDRIRIRARRLSERAHRAQVRTVQLVEEAAADLRHYVLRRSSQIPRVVGGASARVRASVRTAVSAINGAAENTAYNINAHDTANETGVDNAAETTVDNIRAVVEESGTEITTAFDDVMSAFDIEAGGWQTVMEGVPAGLDPTLPSFFEGRGEALKISYRGANDYERYKDERRGVNMPAFGRQLLADLNAGGVARGENLVSEQTRSQIALQFLQSTNPAAVATDRVGGVNEETMTCEAEVTTTRLASARERALATVERTRHDAVEQLERTERDLIRGLQRAGRMAQQALRQQAIVMENGLRSGAGPFADWYRGFMKQARKRFPRGRFYDLADYEPLLDGFDDTLESTQDDQTRVVDERSATMRGEADDS
ncbi:MAG: hypothetical protein IT378_10075, partial [Sandaracinaceae bacterium]|nr:hypothetical protein [Sandaracinaceae bacterium]